MKYSLPSIAALLVSLTATAGPLQVNATDAYAVRFNLGVIEGWRVAPEAVTRHCKTVDPDGIISRNESLGAWRQANAELISKIRTSFETAVPIVSPTHNPRANPVEAVRAIITIEALKMLFIGKNEEAARSTCRAFFSNPSLTDVTPVTRSLAEVEKWLETAK